MDRIAFTLNGFRVELDSDNNVVVGGEEVDLPGDHLLYFTGGAQIGRVDGRLIVIWPMVDDRLAVASWNAGALKLRISGGVETSGLLGDHDGNPLNDVRTSEGDGPEEEQRLESFVHGQFAAS